MRYITVCVSCLLLFIEDGFLDRIINLPNVKASVTIKDTIEQAKLINVLNNSFKAVLADYNSSKNLSDVKEMQTLMPLEKHTKNEIIYVSCNPATLARDLKYLTEKGCKVKSIQPFDMFCHTYHVETVAIIKVN